MGNNVPPSDVVMYFPSGAGPDTLRENNLGGAISAIQVISSTFGNFAPDLDRPTIGNVGVRGTWSIYFAFYLKNNNATYSINNVAPWVYKAPSDTNIGVQLGKDPAGLNGTAQTIASKTTKPTGVTFVTAMQETTTSLLAVPLMNIGDYFPFWVRVYGNMGIASIPQVTFGIKWRFFDNQPTS